MDVDVQGVLDSHENWRQRALSAEGLLGLVLITLGEDVNVLGETVSAGFPENSSIVIDENEDGGFSIGVEYQ